MKEILFNIMESLHGKLVSHRYSSFHLSNQIEDIWLAFCAVYIDRTRPEGQIVHVFLTLLPNKIEAK